MAMRAEFADTMGVETSREIRPPVYADYVLGALQDWRREGVRTALVTLVGIDGSSPRPLGSQIAVAEDGRAVGAVTGGCAEQALVLDALTAIAKQQNHVELYGKGSRFKDIILPCGSGAFIYFDVTLSDQELTRLTDARAARRKISYVCEGPDGIYERVYQPQPRMVIFGRGNVVPPMAQLARMTEFDTHIFCPDEWTRLQCAPYARTYGLTTPNDWNSALIDERTAIVSLFHDHTYEPDILGVALKSPAAYIGALGSLKTHRQRLEMLGSEGWQKADLDKIRGPVGLDIGAKTPPEIAVSIMAEVIAEMRGAHLT